MKTLRCVSLAKTGLLHVAVPLHGIEVADGDEFPAEDDLAKELLRNPNFEEVQAFAAPKVAFSSEVEK